MENFGMQITRKVCSVLLTFSSDNFIEKIVFVSNSSASY